jgi:hypothetical protein
MLINGDVHRQVLRDQQSIFKSRGKVPSSGFEGCTILARAGNSRIGLSFVYMAMILYHLAVSIETSLRLAFHTTM